MWSAEVGGSVHSKNRLVSSRQHRATEMRKLRFLSSCQYTHGCCVPAFWAARHTTVCLDHLLSSPLYSKSNYYQPIQRNLLFRTLENEDTCIIQTGNAPKVSLTMYTDLKNQEILIIRTLLVSPKVSLIHRFHSSLRKRTHNRKICYQKWLPK